MMVVRDNDVERKVNLILDNLPVYHGSAVAELLGKTKDRSKIFHLPQYFIELNHDKYLNDDVNHHCLIAGVIASTRTEIIKYNVYLK
jgi:hypothetical protein